jgi:hypothetical protein
MSQELAIPSSITPVEDVAAKLIRALQHGDVALVLTRSKLKALIDMVEMTWCVDADFEILQDLKKLRDETR